MNRRHQQAELIRIITSGARHVLPKGAVIGFDDSRRIIGVLESGYVKRYTITEDGNQSIQALYDVADIFPLTQAYDLLFDLSISTGIEDVYYEALTKSTIYTLSRDELQKHLEANPGLYKDFSFAAGVRLRSNVQKLENASMKSVYKRVVHELLYLAELHGKHDGGAVTFDSPFTHQLIASMLNVARESVSHSMTELHKKGLVSKESCLTIHDIKALRDEL